LKDHSDNNQTENDGQAANIACADTANGGGDVEAALAANMAEQQPITPPTETLLPGVAWHLIQPNQSMVEIASIYRTSAEVLSYLNPEITFSQCDYGLDSGGPRCSVLLQAGQEMRVPAPTPTATLSLTPSGSETPTPSYTPTFNAPSLLSPSNRALYLRGDLITLRWVPTGSLASDESYLVRIRDVTTDAVFEAYTTQLYYLVPSSVRARMYSDTTIHGRSALYGVKTPLLQRSRPSHVLSRGKVKPFPPE